MNQKALKTLEYTKIIAQLESHAASPLGKASAGILCHLLTWKKFAPGRRRPPTRLTESA